MKLVLNQLNAHLKQKLAPIYIVASDEILLVDEACAAIREAAKMHGFATREVYHSDSNFSWENLTYLADSFSLFSNKTLLELRVNKWPDVAKKALQSYVSNIPPDKILLIVTNKMDANQLKARWLQDVEKASVIVQIWPIDQSALPNWVRQRLLQTGLQANNEVCQLLAMHCEGNLLAAAQEIEKLSLLYPAGVITTDQVMTALTDNSRFDVFNLVDSALSGDAERVFRIVQNLQKEGVEPILVLWALAKELRVLAQLSSQSENIPIEKALQQAGVWQRRQALMKQALKRLTVREWRQLVVRANSLDNIIKGVAKGNIWGELMDLALGFTKSAPLLVK